MKKSAKSCKKIRDKNQLKANVDLSIHVFFISLDSSNYNFVDLH